MGHGHEAIAVVVTNALFLARSLSSTPLPGGGGTCLPKKTLKIIAYLYAAFNILTDSVLAVGIPVPLLWRVQMNRRQKISLMGLFGLGIFVTAAGIVKMAYFPNYGKTGDWLWDTGNIIMWWTLEYSITIIAGNLAALKPLFRRVLGSHERTSSTYLSHVHSGTKGHLSSKSNNYNLLSSSKERDRTFEPHGVYESHMMTTVGAGKERAGSASSIREEASGRNDSGESVVLLDDKANPFGKKGSIMKTTEVTTNVDTVSTTTEGLRPEHKEAQTV
ncbi:hypothetical protein CC80DRAFT_510831 [Byssothecium circinans]|uniref:Rhodopsin domain-containing protein n=1 Tax=Byssothecium circinans TaxID=147558 RepID=A0A6A5TA98_9PLEO|nr:hypothetical protein CC80DRAFT_510831 [Byssothecium circinans]